MALFKISKGTSANLENQSKVPGYCYFTTDESMFYIDVDGSTRKALNADGARKVLVPIYDNEGNITSYSTEGATLATVFNDSTTQIPTNSMVIGRVNPIAFGTMQIKQNDTIEEYANENIAFTILSQNINIPQPIAIDWDGNMSIAGNVDVPTEPTLQSHVANKAYVDAKFDNFAVGLTHYNSLPALGGETTFDFGIEIKDNNALVYYNGILLIKDIHYTIDENLTTIRLLDWSAEEGDICHVVKFVGGTGAAFVGLEANATAADIMNGKKAYNNDGQIIEGTFTIEEELDMQDNLVQDFDSIVNGEAINE